MTITVSVQMLVPGHLLKSGSKNAPVFTHSYQQVMHSNFLDEVVRKEIVVHPRTSRSGRCVASIVSYNKSTGVMKVCCRMQSTTQRYITELVQLGWKYDEKVGREYYRLPRD